MSAFRFLYLNYADTESMGVTIGILELAWRKMEAQRLAPAVFYDGSIRYFEDFVGHLLRPGCVPVAVFFADESLAAVAWLNGFEGRTARGHFVFFKEFWGRERSIPLGRALFRYLLTREDDDGYLWDSLVGITPTSNRMAWRRAIECGAVLVGTIPRFCIMADGSAQDGVSVAVTRESLDGGKA